MNIRQSFIIIIIFVSRIFAQKIYLEKFNPDSLRFKTSYATRCVEPPNIDGRLDDDSWVQALPVNDFFQIEPIEFSAPSEQTFVRVIYDDNAIYISFECKDSNPEKIRKPLTRRDNYMDGFSSASDFVGFAIDSRNDDYNGNWFVVNAAGVKIDVSVSGHEEYDPSWDAVWDAAVDINDSGYSV
jgi:hypothetical protein